MRLYLFLIGIGLSSVVFGQNHLTNYSPLLYTPLEDEELELLKSSFERRADALELSGKNQKKRAQKLIQRLSESLAQNNAKGALSRGDKLSEYLQKIVDRIVQHNNLQPGYYQVYLALTDIPNASNYGEGIIVFNLGLLAQLPDEAHIAFVLSHEMGHDLEDHVFGGIEQKAEVLESEVFKKRLKEIEDLPYNQRAAAIQLRNEYLSQFNEHGRENELHADSLGLMLFYNAGYRIQAGVESIRLLDTADYLPKTQINYAKFYHFERFPFQDKWLMEEKQTSWGSNLDAYKLPDSLKTHPSCALRESSLNRLIKGVQPRPGEKSIEEGEYYHAIAIFELLEYLKKNGHYGEMLYRALAVKDKYPDNIYVKNSIGFAMYGIYTAQYSHLFSRAVPMAKTTMQDDYAQFLSFLHRLNLSALKNQFSAYVEERLPEKGTDDYTDLLHTLAAGIEDEDPEERGILVENYYIKYGENSHYTYLIKQFPEPKRKKKRK